MFWKKKLKSEEYNKLASRIQDLELRMKSLELDLQLYTKKLKQTKGIKDLNKEDDNPLSEVLLRSNN